MRRFIIHLAMAMLFFSGCAKTNAIIMADIHKSLGSSGFKSAGVTIERTAGIIVRSGNSSQDAVGANASADEFSSLLELELQRAGFTVRDRQLVEVRIRNAEGTVDYQTIADETGVEYIFEIATITKGWVSPLLCTQNSQTNPPTVPRTAEYMTNVSWEHWEVAVDVVRIRDNMRVGRFVGRANHALIAQIEKEAPLGSCINGNCGCMDAFSEAYRWMKKVPHKDNTAKPTWEFPSPIVPVSFALKEVVKQL